jgi:Fe-S-cluster containining protein
MRFYEWNYDSDIVTEYHRSGECKQCGKCCQAQITFNVVKPRRNIGRKGGATTNELGVWSEVNLGRWSYFWKITDVDFDYDGCECQNEKGLCDYHDEKENICALWPMSPKCLEHFPDCGYAFEKTGEWKISEL